MENSFFVLDNNFWVDASLNTLTSNETGLQTRLEPRLIAILQLLAQYEGKLVSREMLIATIWDNYGGAEDGLNQGISILRKALGDTHKKVIETIPKKGYILHAAVTYTLNEKKVEPQKEKKSKNRPFFFAIVLGIFILIALLLVKSEKQPDSFSPSAAAVSKNWQGKNYKLLFDKNKKMILFENNIKIEDRNLPHYEIVIQELKDKLTSKQDANR